MENHKAPKSLDFGAEFKQTAFQLIYYCLVILLKKVSPLKI